MESLDSIGQYATVVIDPPWPIQFGNGKDTLREVFDKNQLNPVGQRGKAPGYAKLPYDSMELIDIAALPLASVLLPDSLLFVWATMKHLPDVFPMLEGWGVRYHYVMTWHKPWGPKPLTRPMYNSEFIVVAGRGSPDYLDHKAFFTAYSWPNLRKHSQKPEEFYDLLRRVTSGPRLDIFGRRRIAGFDSWGLEAPDGPAEPDHFRHVLV